MCSLFYIPLHLFACRKGKSLYFDPPIPSFQHQLHAWATLTIHITATMWASATIPAAVAIYRSGGTANTVHLKVDMFACATGLLFTCLILAVVQLAHRPFTLPWLSPPPVFDEEDGSSRAAFDKFRDKTTAASTLRGSPPTQKPPLLLLLPSSGATSISPSTTCTTRSRARNMTRTRRYVLEAPTPPVPLSPPQPLKRGGSLSGTETDGETGLSIAGSSSGSSSSRGGGSGSSRVAPASTAASTVGSGGAESRRRRRLEDELVPSAGESPSLFRFRRKTAPKVPQGGGGDEEGKGVVAESSAPPPAPTPTPPPPPTYYVPGAWVLQGPSDEGMVEDV
jgi:hypothetical protein